jgi:Carboxypeptidase regulatory-like domain/TonB dependent receptor
LKHIRAPRLRFLALTLFLVCAATAAAQSFPGRINGVVKDTQGAAVPDATVKLTNPSTGLERTETTDANGEFNFPELALGTYRLTVSKAGFQTLALTDIATSESQVNTVTPTLTVGTVTSEVEVTSAPALLQTETASVGGQLTEQQVTNLPIGNSDYTRLALVLPGVTQNSNFAFAQYTINGSRSRSNGFNIDGASDTDPSTYLPSINEGGNSATAATRLPLDAIQEVSIVAAGGADSGQNSGSVMNVIVRSGTNQFHGSAYEVHRDAALDAANFFETPSTKAPFVWNEYGGTIGGPIIIPHVYNGTNRTFFFAGYDGSQLRLGVTQNGFAPTPAQIAADTAIVQSKGIVPNQLGLNILGLYSSLGLSGPFVADNRGQQSPNSGVLKIDHKISDSDSLSGRYLQGNGEDEFPGGGPGPGGGSQLNPWFGVTPTVASNFAVSEVHVFNPNLINTLRLGWNRFSQFQKGRDADVDPATLGFDTGVGPESFGIPEVDIGSSFQSATFTPGRFSNLGLQNGAGGRVATSYQIADDVSWTRGKNAFKFGFNYLHNYSDYTVVGTRGIFTFDGSQLAIPDGLANNGFDASLIDLIAGLPSPGASLTNITRAGTNRVNVDQNIISGFAMDNYKLTPNLTLIAGLRYDFFTTVHEDHGRFSAFDPTLGLVPVAQLPGGKLYNAPKNNWGPRIALAWTPPIELIHGRQTVVRAGFGVYYDTIPLNNFEEGLALNPVGATAGVTIVPTAPIPFGVGIPTFGTGTPTPPFNVTSIQHNLKTPNTQIWTLNIQQELSQRFVFQIGYVGNHSIHQLQLLDINQPPPGDNDPAAEQARRPLNTEFPTLSQINTISSAGWSHYNSLQAILKSNNWHGLTTQVSFTWSHNLDTASEVEDFSGTSGFVPQDARNLAGSYGNSEFDQRRALIFTYVYALPNPKLQGAFGYALKDWQLSGTTTMRDGLAAPLLTFGDESGVGNFHTRFNCIAPIHYQLRNLSLPYASQSSFAAPPEGTFGDCPRNPLVAPGLQAWDISIQRTFRFGERWGLEFRTSFFNAFNHPNFAEPSPDITTQITASADDGSFDSHFGVGGPRNIQFMLRLMF